MEMSKTSKFYQDLLRLQPHQNLEAKEGKFRVVIVRPEESGKSYGSGIFLEDTMVANYRGSIDLMYSIYKRLSFMVITPMPTAAERQQIKKKHLKLLDGGKK